ncbi:hypothetical protein [Laspinema palackyanum]
MSQNRAIASANPSYCDRLNFTLQTPHFRVFPGHFPGPNPC